MRSRNTYAILGLLPDEKFAAAGLRLEYQAFAEPTYPQLSADTHHGLSIIDTLMHCGADGTARLLGPIPC